MKHAKKSDIAVKKYKTNKKMARRNLTDRADGFQYASFDQDQYGFPYDMILDGDTGAVEYVPVY